MAEHMWFIPVTGGHAPMMAEAFTSRASQDLADVQWDFSRYPVFQDPTVGPPCLGYNSATIFTMGNEGPPILESKLIDCYGSWAWRSCRDNNNIAVGGQLAVGTVFSRTLPLDNLLVHLAWTTWAEVDVWAKYRVDVPARLDNIFLTINDNAGLSSSGPNLLPGLTPAASWRIAYHTNAAWTDWENRNLRVTMSFQGTTNPANIGPVRVDMEWFAIRLRGEA
jgi:hypothetical protein